MREHNQLLEAQNRPTAEKWLRAAAMHQVFVATPEQKAMVFRIFKGNKAPFVGVVPPDAKDIVRYPLSFVRYADNVYTLTHHPTNPENIRYHITDIDRHFQRVGRQTIIVEAEVMAHPQGALVMYDLAAEKWQLEDWVESRNDLGGICPRFTRHNADFGATSRVVRPRRG